MTLPKIYGLIGYPVKHSLSPLMHNAAFKALKINAEYKLFPLEEKEEVGPFLKNLKQNNIFGLNVTIPYKGLVLDYLDEVDEEARQIGAVNTVTVSDSRLKGYNTDGAGFLKHLTTDLGFHPENKRIAIIGAGGASKAVAFYLAKTKPKAITFYDIDKEKSEALVAHLKDNFKGAEIKNADSLSGLTQAVPDLLVNTTPIGMKDSDSSLADELLINKDTLVYDLIYNPAETELLRIAKEKVARVSNGLGMLLYQGASAFEFWFPDKKAPIEVMREALMKGARQ
ncbi:MAG: shikimate dehydrogenase [Candidatus Omnitrophota bacterium]